MRDDTIKTLLISINIFYSTSVHNSAFLIAIHIFYILAILCYIQSLTALNLQTIIFLWTK